MGIQLPSRRLVSQEDTSMVQKPRVARSRFVGRKTRLAAYRQGYLYPFHVDEVYPGDHFKYEIDAYFRLSTLVFPQFSGLRADTFAFFVPLRLLWDNFKKFMGEQASPADSIAYTIPQVVSSAGGFAQFSIYDHMGIAPNGQITAGQTVSVNVLPFRAYGLIYDAWFRDQNLQSTAGMLSRGDGPDTEANYTLMRRGKAHDYFTTVLTAPQKFTAPTVALGTSAPVRGIGSVSGWPGAGALAYQDVNLGTGRNTASTWRSSVDDIVLDTGGVYADLSAATGISINTLRQAWLIQSMLERDARGGTRYPETVLAHFDVRTPDFRVQRPEYIGGGSTVLNITAIAQTATGGGGLGALGGAGIGAGQHRGSYAATEHGIILWLINFRSELAYQQGIPRMFRRSTRTDMMWPDLAGLGEQSVLREEIYATGVDADDATVFGYQERYHELRTMYSDVVGIMRSTATGTLHAWHLAQLFSAAPVPGDTFIVDNAPMDRILAAGSAAVNQQIIADININRDVVRALPLYGTPAALGRF